MDLLIVGAGGLGREIFSWLINDIKNLPDIHIKGFLDDHPNTLDNYSYPAKIIGNITDYQPKKNESLILAVMDPTTKKNIVGTLLKKNANFFTFVHSTAIIGHNIKIGQGCVICPRCIVSSDVTLGEFVFINITSNIGHDVKVGSYTSINSKVEITGNVSIGEECFFGVGAKVIPKRHIGNKAKIGAGSMVIKNIPQNITVFGNPAKKISK